MEQAVNQFNKGLLIDTHPMVLGNDTLSDALNATFVTMNGNEVVLQNDMGNRRIDNAFLPSGYLPLGMKEYGGVIYVAAYNPITNRGLVGSFPSPQRRVNITNEDGYLSFNSFIEEVYAEDGSSILYYIINKEYIIVPLSDDIVLHTGDKFSIYSPLINDILQYLLPEEKDGGLKNNLFTFLVGVFNSQNEFIDITDKLKIWDNGYFIKDIPEVIEGETIDDSNLLKARNSLAINTYSQKMSSPLYLKATINHIDNISYSITGEITGENTVKLEIEVTFFYNCIDNINDNEFFKIHFNGLELTKTEVLKESIYLPELEQYSVTYLYETGDITVSEALIKGLEKYKYQIKFPLLHNYDDWKNPLDNRPIYIESLNKEGEIDLSKLNSDTLIFKGYRYYNNTTDKLTTLIVNLESYPKKKNSKLKFYTKIIDPSDNSTVTIDEEEYIIKKDKPGIGTITTQFPYRELEERKLYKFVFSYVNDDNGTPKETIEGFYITTSIFNGNYIGERGGAKEDYSNVFDGDEIHYSYDLINNLYIDDFSKITEILLLPKLSYEISSVPIEKTFKTNGTYLYPLNTQENISTYQLTETTTILNTIVLSAAVDNIEVYPKEVESLFRLENDLAAVLSRYIDDVEIKKSEGETSYKFENKNLYKEINNYDSNVSIDENDIISISEETSSSIVNQNIQKIEIKSIIDINNIVKGLLETKTIYCNHVISSFKDLIKRHYYGNNQSDTISIKAPYITIDWESTRNASIVSSRSIQELKTAINSSEVTDLAGLINRGTTIVPLIELKYYIEEVVRDSISDYIQSSCEGHLLVGELNVNDSIGGFTPCVLSETRNLSEDASEPNGVSFVSAPVYKRLWLKINKKDYIPIYTVLKDFNRSRESFEEDFYKDNGAFDLLSQIPHYYEYETGGRNLLEKIINPTSANKTAEFEADSNINVLIKENVELIEGANNIYKLLNNNSTIEELISFKECVVSSNEGFMEDLEELANSTINSAIMYGTIDDHILYIRDIDGEAIDPLFVYYDDSELKEGITTAFKKSYIAEKSYASDLDLNIPELKSSRKLYKGKYGEHELILEYVVYPKYEGPYKDVNGEDILDLQEGNWKDKTLIQWENSSGNGQNKWRLIPLKTKNIFNRSTILKYKILTEDGINSNMGRSGKWIDYDDYINNSNSNP